MSSEYAVRVVRANVFPLAPIWSGPEYDKIRENPRSEDEHGVEKGHDSICFVQFENCCLCQSITESLPLRGADCKCKPDEVKADSVDTSGKVSGCRIQKCYWSSVDRTDLDAHQSLSESAPVQILAQDSVGHPAEEHANHSEECRAAVD